MGSHFKSPNREQAYILEELGSKLGLQRFYKEQVKRYYRVGIGNLTEFGTIVTPALIDTAERRLKELVDGKLIMPKIFTDSVKVDRKSIDTLIRYLWDDECKSFQETNEDSRDNHIFNVLVRIDAQIGASR